MHPEHRALLDQLRQAARPLTGGRFDPQSYFGSGHAFLNVRAPEQRRIARAWVAAHKSSPPDAVIALADSLFEGAALEEKTLAALLIEACRPARLAVRPADVERWLEHLVGWAEVDSLCQNLFTADQMLADWAAWSALIRRLVRDPNINKRRAGLVLLSGVVHRNGEARLAALAFEMIETLKHERPVIITKAISWLLRGLLNHHRDEVAAYLDREAASLPAIAVRETRAKLVTGRKSGKA